jgi:hypothetical protein
MESSLAKKKNQSVGLASAWEMVECLFQTEDTLVVIGPASSPN